MLIRQEELLNLLRKPIYAGMAIPEAPKFSLENEVEKLRKYLLLPITHVEFDPGYEHGKMYIDNQMNIVWIDAKLFVNDELIGTIPYFTDRDFVGYDTSNHSVFAWDKIYRQFQQVIFDKILQQEPLAFTAEAAEYEPRASLTLNVKDKEGTLIKKVGCHFIDGQWDVHVFALNTITVTKRIQVTLTPPPPINTTDNQISPQ